MNNLPTPSPKFLQNLPPYFFMVHLHHRLYGVGAPGALRNTRQSFVVQMLATTYAYNDRDRFQIRAGYVFNKLSNV